MTRATGLGRVAALGPYIVDVLGRPVSEIPPGQGGILLEEIKMTVAGTGGGAAVDLAKLGWDVSAYGAIATDGLGVFLRSQLEQFGVDTSGLVEKDGVQTSSTILPIRANGERPSMHVRGATQLMSPADLDLDRLRGADALLVGGPETMPGFLSDDGIAVLSGFRASGSPVFMDLLHSGVPAERPTLLKLIAQTDWFMPNDDQLRGLTGIDDLVAAARAVLDAGARGVAVTTGGEGALLVRPGAEPIVVPAFATNVIDTTGCGDSFNSGMITGILAGCPPEDAAVLGCACGALVASGLGSDAGIVDADGVLAVIARENPDAATRIAARLDERRAR